MAKDNFTIIETFVGAGGSFLGFKREGFCPLYVNDFDKKALATLIYNNKELQNGECIVDNRDITTIDTDELRNRIGINKGDLDVLIGGVVCKGFSLAGNQSPFDKRNYLYLSQLDFVNSFLPKISIIENVPNFINGEVVDKDLITEEDEKAITSMSILEQKKYLREKNKLIKVIDDIENRYRALGYTLYRQILNSGCYGAGTKRERIILVAVRNDVDEKVKFKYPLASHYTDKLMKKYPYLYQGQNVQKATTVRDCLNSIDYNNKDDWNNTLQSVGEQFVKRCGYLKQGEALYKIMGTLPLSLQSKVRYGGSEYKKLDENDLMLTLVAGNGHGFIHPKEDRPCTIREFACMTSFPNDYMFIGRLPNIKKSQITVDDIDIELAKKAGNKSGCLQQISNAIPPLLSKAIARSVKETLETFYHSN